MKILMKMSVIFFLIQSTLAFSFEANHCSKTEFVTLGLAHETAKAYIEKAHDLLQDTNNPLVINGFKKYFNVDPASKCDQKHIAKIKKIMGRLWSKVSRVKYKCASDRGLYCSPGTLALVPPLSRIQICPSYFSRSFEKQVGTLIHEWGHRWGFFRLKYIFEKYCHETVGAPASVLVKQPDSYMLFTYYLATQGQGIGCFKIADLMD